jgi:hypothetical protein
LAGPRQHGGPGHDRQGAGDDPLIRFLPEHDPGDRHRADAFEIHQERAGGRIDADEAENEKQRTANAARSNRRQHPGPVFAAEPGFGSRNAPELSSELKDDKTAASAQIEETGKHPRLDRSEQHLRQRNAGAPQNRRRQGVRNTAPEMLYSQGLAQPLLRAFDVVAKAMIVQVSFFTVTVA